MIFDTHAHYDDPKFDPDREEVLASLEPHGIGTVVNVCSDVPSFDTTLELVRKYPFLYGAFGVHPSELEGFGEDEFARLGRLLDEDKAVAVGEIGLDYYWEKDEKVKEQQRYWFRRQFVLAKEKKMPAIIHSREAAADTVDILEDLSDGSIPVDIHCYSYSPEIAKRLLKNGNTYFGIGGVLTFKNAKKLRETAEILPADRILLETDCPYLAPEPNRGKRNSSLNLRYVVQALAQIRGVSEEKVIEQTTKNAETFYGLSK